MSGNEIWFLESDTAEDRVLIEALKKKVEAFVERLNTVGDPYGRYGKKVGAVGELQIKRTPERDVPGGDFAWPRSMTVTVPVEYGPSSTAGATYGASHTYAPGFAVWPISPGKVHASKANNAPTPRRLPWVDRKP